MQKSVGVRSTKGAVVCGDSMGLISQWSHRQKDGRRSPGWARERGREASECWNIETEKYHHVFLNCNFGSRCAHRDQSASQASTPSHLSPKRGGPACVVILLERSRLAATRLCRERERSLGNLRSGTRTVFNIFLRQKICALRCDMAFIGTPVPLCALIPTRACSPPSCVTIFSAPPRFSRHHLKGFTLIWYLKNKILGVVACGLDAAGAV